MRMRRVMVRMLMVGLAVPPGGQNKVPHPGVLGQQKFDFSQFWRLEVEGHGVGRFGSFGSPRGKALFWVFVVDGPFLPVRGNLHVVFPLERSVLRFPLTRTPVVPDDGPP